MRVDLLWTIFEWLPLVFAVDVLAFHATGDHPLALRWWWRSRGVASVRYGRRTRINTRPHEGSPAWPES
jgi:hypothetical protein